MKKIVGVIAVMVAMLVAKAAQATPACEWEIQKADANANTQASTTNTTTTTTHAFSEGEVVVVVVTTPVRGTMRTPAGWDSRFQAQDACPGFPQGCGTWVISKAVTATDGGPATFTIESQDGCANNVLAVNLEVNAKPAPYTPPPPPYTGVPWTQEEKDTALSRTLATMDIALGYRWIPNLSTMTKMAHGVELQANGRVGEHVAIGGGLWWQQYGKPNWTELRPTKMDTTVNGFSAFFQAAGIITDGESDWHWVEWWLGGRLGAGMLHHPEEYIGGGRYVADSTRFNLWISPMTKVVLYPSRYFGFYGQAELQIDLVPSKTAAGTENIPASRAASPDAVGHVWPAFGLGMVFRP